MEQHLIANAEWYPFINTLLLGALGVILTLFTTLVGWWALNINGSLKELRQELSDLKEKELSDLKTKLAVMSSWTVAHDIKDDERHENTTRLLERNHKTSHDLRNDISKLSIDHMIHERRREKADSERRKIELDEP